MKKILIIVIIIGLGYLIAKASIPKPDQNIPEATNQEIKNPNDTNTSTEPEVAVPAENIQLNFSGYGPGKEHDGTITVRESSLVRAGDTFKGGVIIDMNTIASSPDLLNKDLKSGRFFDVATYPNATFLITQSTETEIKGNLTIKGQTQSIVIPVSYDASTESYVSTVRINMESFGIKQALADKEFVLKISVKK